MKKLLFTLLVGILSLTMGNLYAQDCPSTAGTTAPDICGFFEVTIDAAMCTTAYGDSSGFLLIYDFDPATVPTQQEIYDDLVGGTQQPDLAYFGETSDCSGLGFVSLAPLPTGCVVQDIAFYLVPANLVALTIDFDCPIEGPITTTAYPTFTALITEEGECGVAPVVELQAADGSVCDVLTGPIVTRPPCTPGFGDDVNTDFLDVNYTDADLAAISGGTPPPGCFGDITGTVPVSCASLACTGGGCQLANLVATSVSCNNNGTAADPSDDFWVFDFEFNFADGGATFSITDDGGGASLAGVPYDNPASQFQTFTGYLIPAMGQSPVTVTITDDADPACSITINVTDLLAAGALVTCSDCTVTSGSTVTDPVCAGSPEDVFTVTINGCMAAPGTNFDDFILIYDIDVTNIPPTDDELYNDVIGATPMPDLINFFEFATCTDSGFNDLEGFVNPSCSPIGYDLYIMPVDAELLLITFDCPIEGPIRLTTPQEQPSLFITGCDPAAGTADVQLGFDIDGDGNLGGPDDVVCDSGTLPVDAAGGVAYTAADIGALFGNDVTCYTDAVATCPCAIQAPTATITGEDCGDGTQGAPYVVGDDDTGVLGGSDIIEYIIVDDAAGTATGVPGAIISVGDLAAAQAAVDAAPEGSDVCITIIAHNPLQLDVVFNDLELCTANLLSMFGGITPPLETFEELYNGLVTINGTNPNLTIANIEALLGGSGGGPGLGGTVDVGSVLIGFPPDVLLCDAPPFCYNVLAETCVTINGACPVACSISNLTVTANACDDNGTPTDITDDTYNVDISFDYSNAGATYTIDDGTANAGNAYTTAGSGTETITAYGSYAADGTAVVNITITDDGDATCTASASAGPVANCSMPPEPMATISDPCNCANGIDLDGDGINDLALEVITITDPSGGGQGWALSSNDGGLVGIDGANPTTSPIVDNGDGTYTQTGYVVADGATTYSVEFTSADGEVLTISGGPCAACPAPLEEVPTVGEWGLIILGLLMSIAAIVGIRQRRLEEITP